MKNNEMNTEHKTITQKSIEHKIKQYVFDNARVVYVSSTKSFTASINLCGYHHVEKHTTRPIALGVLANELSRSKYIQANFNTHVTTRMR